jgi:hypothetical protein
MINHMHSALALGLFQSHWVRKMHDSCSRVLFRGVEEYKYLVTRSSTFFNFKPDASIFPKLEKTVAHVFVEAPTA